MTEYEWKAFSTNLVLHEFDLDVEDVPIQLRILQALLAVMKEALGRTNFDPPILRDEGTWMLKNERPSALDVVNTIKELAGKDRRYLKYSNAAQYWLDQNVGMKTIPLAKADEIYPNPTKQRRTASKV